MKATFHTATFSFLIYKKWPERVLSPILLHFKFKSHKGGWKVMGWKKLKSTLEFYSFKEMLEEKLKPGIRLFTFWKLDKIYQILYFRVIGWNFMRDATKFYLPVLYSSWLKPKCGRILFINYKARLPFPI